MATLQSVAVICVPCRKGWHVKPEDAYELRKVGELEWSQFRTLECPDCKGTLRRMAEDGQPMMASISGYWPASTEVRWME